MRTQLTLQIQHHGQWHNAAVLIFPAPEKGRQGPVRLGYETDYALDWLQRDDEHACSLTLPVELMFTHEAPRWFALFDDLMPGGAARRYWVEQLGLGNLPSHAQDFELLRRGTIAPTGNLRIKEALPTLPPNSLLADLRFALADVVDRQTDFIEYAQQMGAVSGGATGAGGEAPKLLLRCSAQDEIWIDTFQDEYTCPDRHYLVKFPRNRRSAMDCDILRAEYHYYQELAALGVDTIDIKGMRLLEGEHFPSLWLPRFDRTFTPGTTIFHGLESVYSLLNKPAGALLDQFTALRTLVKLLRRQYRVSEFQQAFDTQAFVLEWVRRDLLNVAFGNSDNHGRNTALLKRPEGMWLAPVYDFAPMRADPEGVIRGMRWGSPWEEGGRFDWHGIARALADLAEPDALLANLGTVARHLYGLRERLAARGVPVKLLDLPALGLATLEHRLREWKLP